MSIEVTRSIFELLTPENATLIATLFACGFLSFSTGTWKEIMKRDGGVSRISGLGPPDHRVEAAHINHKRGFGYDRASNGRLLTIREHYKEHIEHYRTGIRGGHSVNGCSPEGNLEAATRIWERMTDDEKAGLIPPSEYEVVQA